MTETSTFDLRNSADWLADHGLNDLDREREVLLQLVDAAAVAADAPAALRPTGTDPTPALVRLFNHHACTLQRRQRLAA